MLSILYLRCRDGNLYALTEDGTFNSLFEMLHGLRCDYGGGVGGVSFNSLFEMPGL